MHWLALLIAVLSNATANVAFKKAITNTPIEPDFSSLMKLATDPWMWLGVASACLLLGSYLYALKGLGLSLAYPAVTGLAMLAIALTGATFLGESISAQKLIAMALILLMTLALIFL